MKNSEFDRLLERLQEFTDSKDGLKNSKKREFVLRALYESSKHLNSDDVYARIKQKYDASIGIATVYRVLSLLEDAGLVRYIVLGNTKYYEIDDKKHHDHLVCIGCGVVVEFFDEIVEKKQDDIAKKNGFDLINHDMTLYGLCAECRKEER